MTREWLPLIAYVALALVVGLSSAGCSDSSSAGSGGTPRSASTCRLADALHEHQLVRSGLRATPNDVVVGRLETGRSGASVASEDSGSPGIDVLPYRIADDSDFEIGLGNDGTAGSVRLVNASGRIVAEARASAGDHARTTRVRVGAGDYTLEITSDGSREAHYVVVPIACAVSGSSGTTTARASQTAQTPGVYVQEAGASTAIVGASTSVAAFVGFVGVGPIGKAVQLTSADDLTSTFGAAAATSAVGVSVAQFFANGGSIAWVVGAASAAVTDVVGSSASSTGLYALDAAQGWSLLVMPDLATMSPNDAESMLASALPYALQRNAFTIVDAPESLATSDAYGGWVRQSLTSGASVPQSYLSFAATYFPQILVEDASGVQTTVTAGGAVAGVFAQNDATHGVSVDPAGSPNGVIADAVGASLPLDDADVASLTSSGANTIRSGVAFGGSTVLDGARTLGDATTNGAYVSASRTDLYIRASIQESLQWVVFEPDDESLWEAVTQQLTAFLTPLWQEGGLVGSTQAEAFVVTCDTSTNPPDAILNGVMNVEVSVWIVGNPEPMELTFTFLVEAGG